MGLEFLYLGHTLVGGADDGPVGGQVFVAVGQFGALPPPVIHPAVDLAARGDKAAPLHDVRHPVDAVLRVPNYLFLRFGHVEVTEEGNFRHGAVVAGSLRLLHKAVAQVQGKGGVLHHGNAQVVAGGYQKVQGGLGAGGCDVDGRMGLLQGRRHQVNVLQLVVGALVAEPRGGPQSLYDLDGVLEPAGALGGVQPVTGVFVAAGTPAKAHVQPPVADQVQHGPVLGQAHGVVQGRHQHRRPHPDFSSAGRDVGGENQRRRHHAVAGEVVLGQPGADETQFFGVLHLLGDFLNQLLGLGALGPGDMAEKREFHWSITFVK